MYNELLRDCFACGETKQKSSLGKKRREAKTVLLHDH
jgi:hypothetical protein